MTILNDGINVGGTAAPPPGGDESDPQITGLNPAVLGVADGPTEITVTGTNFAAESTVEVDQVAVPTVFGSSTTLTATFDPEVEGDVVFTVRNPNEEESNDFTLTVGATSFDPSSATIPDVQAYVNENPDEAEAILDAEESGKNRVTLVDWLHEKIEEN